MTKAICGTAVIAAITALAASGVAGAARTTPGVTFHLVEKDKAFHFVDNKPIGGPNAPPSLGDMFAFSSTLWTRAGKRAGTLYATCVVASGGRRNVMQCNGTFALKGGELSAIALVRDEEVTHIAIVGGTGAYEGARGQVTSVSRGESSPFSDDTFHLLPKSV
jgi:hypothetical protein